MSKLRKQFRGLFVGGAVLFSGSSFAAIINSPVPDSLIVDRGGFEWVWASPVAADGSWGGGSAVELNWNFRLPSVEEWTASFTGVNDLYSAFVTNTGNICASGYFTNIFSHCDAGDITYEGGYVWGAPFATHPQSGYSETFLVRDGGGQVPLPATLSLLGVGLLALGLTRRK